MPIGYITSGSYDLWIHASTSNQQREIIMYDIFYAIGFVIVYGILSLVAFLIYKLIKRTKWNPWFRALAFVPFITYWILTYQPKDAIYYSAFERVTRVELPDDFDILLSNHSDYDDFGDYYAFAVFKVDTRTFKKVDESFEIRSKENTTEREIPKSVKEYLYGKSKNIVRNAYHYWKLEGLELYGATLSDNQTVIIYRSSW